MVGGTFKGQAVNSHVVLFRNSHGYTNTSYPVLSGGSLILRFSASWFRDIHRRHERVRDAAPTKLFFVIPVAYFWATYRATRASGLILVMSENGGVSLYYHRLRHGKQYRQTTHDSDRRQDKTFISIHHLRAGRFHG